MGAQQPMQSSTHRHVTTVVHNFVQGGSAGGNGLGEIASPPPTHPGRPVDFHGRLQSLYKDGKEEHFHIKTARTFFCL